MKKLLLLFVSVLLLTSCKKEDDSTIDISNTDLFVGTWKMTDAQVQAITNTFFVQNFEIPLTVSVEDYNMDMTISESPNEYNFDGTLTIKTEFTNPLTSEVISIEEVDQPIEGLNSGSWEITDDTIIFTSNTGDISTLTIQNIDENNLVLKEIKEETETNSDFGIELDVTISTESTFTFVK